MGAQMAITHALNAKVGTSPACTPVAPLCGQCAGFGEVRVATHTARYLPSSVADDAQPESTETLCAPCASTPWVYTDVQPLAPVRARGVSLVKATDRPNGVVMVPSEYALDERRDPGFAVEGLPGWVSRGLFRNSPHHLGEAFARLVPVTLAPYGLDQDREFI